MNEGHAEILGKLIHRSKQRKSQNLPCRGSTGWCVTLAGGLDALGNRTDAECLKTATEVGETHWVSKLSHMVELSIVMECAKQRIWGRVVFKARYGYYIL